MQRVSLFLLIFFSLMVWSAPVRAEVIMTEVYPAPSEGFEWVEICNSGQESIALSNYVLLDGSGKKLSMPQILLAPQQYVLATSSGVLNNTGDSVFLQKNGLTIESMNYDTPVNAQQSYISCNAVWTLTNVVTPGFENVGCAITPAVTASAVTPALTITQAVVPTRTPAVSPRAGVTITGTAVVPAQTYEPTPKPPAPKSPPVSFQQKHAPVVLGTTSAISPTHTPSRIISPDDLVISTPYDSRLLTIATMTISLAILLSLILFYRTAHKLKNSYNVIHDT